MVNTTTMAGIRGTVMVNRTETGAFPFLLKLTDDSMTKSPYNTSATQQLKFSSVNLCLIELFNLHLQ
jgi:hypothetical protein